MQSSHRSSSSHRGRGSQKASGFTLVETLVALAILSLMLTILFVPLNLGVNFTSIGTARADAQQAAQVTLNRISTELRKAIFVFPNERMAGVTSSFPYTNNPDPNPAVPKNLGFPYYQQKPTGSLNVCDSDMIPVDNTSRIDFILPRQKNNEPQLPITSSGNIVTYYARRQDTSKPWNDAVNSFSPNDNPIVLHRAQMPYREFVGNSSAEFLTTGGTPNVDTKDSRYASTASCGNNTTTNRGSLWLTQNGAGEPQVGLPASTENGNTPAASDARVTPLGMGLFAPKADPADPTQPRSYKPETTFQCEDTNSDGRIDRVRVTIAVGNYDSRGAENKAQAVRFSNVVDLPNVR